MNCWWEGGSPKSHCLRQTAVKIRERARKDSDQHICTLAFPTFSDCCLASLSPTSSREAPLIYLWSLLAILPHCLQTSIRVLREISSESSLRLPEVGGGRMCTSGHGSHSPKPSNAELGYKGLLLAQYTLHSGQDWERGLTHPSLHPSSSSALKTQPKCHL